MIETSEVNIDNREERKKYLVSLSKIETYFDEGFWDGMNHGANFRSWGRKFGRGRRRKGWNKHRNKKRHS